MATDDSKTHSPDLLTVNETADFLRLKVSTLRAWILDRRVPFVKLGGKRVFFRRSDLEAFISSSVVPARIAGKPGPDPTAEAKSAA